MSSGSRAESGTDGRRWPALETLQSLLTGACAAIAGIAPRALPIALALTALASVAALATGPGVASTVRKIARSGPILWAFLLLAYAALSASWASVPWASLISVAETGGVIASAAVLSVLLPSQLASLPAERRRRFIRSVPIGGMIGLAFILVEFATAHALSHFVIARVPVLMGANAKDFVRKGDELLGLAPFYLDRNVAATALLLPAMAMGFRRWLPETDARKLMLALAVGGLMVVGASMSGAAKLAVAGGILAGLSSLRWPIGTGAAIRAILIAGVILAIPLAQLPSRLGVETAQWAPPSMRERASIWRRTAHAIAERPVLGIGAQSTRYQSNAALVRIDGVRGERLTLGTHAHNVVLQAWLELGAIGAFLLLGVALAIARSAAAMPSPEDRLAGIVTMAMAVAVAVTGWGLWQPWLAASFATPIVALTLVSAPPTKLVEH